MVPVRLGLSLYCSVTWPQSSFEWGEYLRLRGMTRFRDGKLILGLGLACGNPRDLFGVIREFVAPPGNVQIGSYENQIVLKNFACNLTGNF